MKSGSCRRMIKEWTLIMVGVLLVLGVCIAVGSVEVNAETKAFTGNAISIEYETDDLTITNETCGDFQGDVFVFDAKKAGLPKKEDCLIVETEDDEYYFYYDSSKKKFIASGYEQNDEGEETEVDYTIDLSQLTYVLNDRNTPWVGDYHSGKVILKLTNGKSLQTEFTVYIKFNENLFSYEASPSKIVFDAKAAKKGTNCEYLSLVKSYKYNFYDEEPDDEVEFSARVENKKIAFILDNEVYPLNIGSTNVILKTEDGVETKVPVQVTKSYVKQFLKSTSFDFADGYKKINVYTFPGTKVKAKIGGKTYKCTANKYGIGKIKLKKMYFKGAKAKVTLKKGSVSYKFKTKAKAEIYIYSVEAKKKNIFVLVDGAKKGYVIKVKAGKKTYTTKATINDEGKGIFTYKIKGGKLKKKQKVKVTVYNQKGMRVGKKTLRVS